MMNGLEFANVTMKMQMRSVQSLFALFACLLTVWPLAAQQQAQLPGSNTEDRPSVMDEPTTYWGRFTQPYRGHVVAPVRLSNSSRLDSLMRAGNIYLSLADAVALALENNIDIEIQRYSPRLAEADLLRARAGAPIRGVQTNASGGAGATSNYTGGAPGSTIAGINFNTSQVPGTSNFSYDPVLIGTISWAHQTSPQSNTVTSGTTSLVTTGTVANFGISQAFLSGTNASLTFNNNDTSQNNFFSLLNPQTVSYMDLLVTQKLLQGFGFTVNNRNIRIAKNDLRVADLTFKMQVLNTVSYIISQYWNLVSYNEDVRVKRQALALSQKLYDDNKKQVEIGTLAPIEIIRAEAEVASRQQDLETSETNVLQEETILKTALSRTGLASPAVASAHIVPTDPIRIPDQEQVRPTQDLIAEALDARPELAQSRILVDNSRISLAGTRSALLPTVDAFARARNTGLAGTPNSLPIPGSNGLTNGRNADPFLVGGYGSVLGQIFSRNFPDYSVGVQLNIPLRNRSAQADYATAQLSLRQSELQVEKLVNGIRIDVQNALTAVRQARARYQSARKNRTLQEQTLDAEQKKYALGASTLYLVIQAQRDLATAQGTEVAAQAAYIQARTQLDVATGTILDNNNVQMDEAMKGSVSRKPSPLPVLENQR